MTILAGDQQSPLTGDCGRAHDDRANRRPWFDARDVQEKSPDPGRQGDQDGLSARKS